MPKLWAIKYRVVFFMKHRVDMDDMVDIYKYKYKIKTYNAPYVTRVIRRRVCCLEATSAYRTTALPAVPTIPMTTTANSK